MDYQDWGCSAANGFNPVNPIILTILILTILRREYGKPPPLTAAGAGHNIRPYLWPDPSTNHDVMRR